MQQDISFVVSDICFVVLDIFLRCVKRPLRLAVLDSNPCSLSPGCCCPRVRMFEHESRALDVVCLHWAKGERSFCPFETVLWRQPSPMAPRAVEQTRSDRASTRGRAGAGRPNCGAPCPPQPATEAANRRNMLFTKAAKQSRIYCLCDDGRFCCRCLC